MGGGGGVGSKHGFEQQCYGSQLAAIWSSWAMGSLHYQSHKDCSSIKVSSGFTFTAFEHFMGSSKDL